MVYNLSHKKLSNEIVDAFKTLGYGNINDFDKHIDIDYLLISKFVFDEIKSNAIIFPSDTIQAFKAITMFIEYRLDEIIKYNIQAFLYDGVLIHSLELFLVLRNIKMKELK